MMAALITLALSGQGWRVAYFIGAVPALLVLWIRASVKEPEKWKQAQANAKEGELGNMLDLFRDPVLRRNTIAGTLLALAGVGGVWGVAFFLPDLVGSVFRPMVTNLPHVLALPEADRAAAIRKTLQDYRSTVSLVQQVGAFLGMFSYAILSERIGRKPALAIFFVAAFVAVQATFWGVRDPLSAYLLAFPLGFCALAPFSAYAVYFPELYPTRLRATGVGFCYNCARLLAATAPYALGSLAIKFADVGDPTLGFRRAASLIACIYVTGFIGLLFAPETKGKPLPE
jgi:hypothetical protein